MAIGSWRTDGCDNRAVRPGWVEPPCEECYWRARQRVADQLAGEETVSEGRMRFRQQGVKGQREAPLVGQCPLVIAGGVWRRLVRATPVIRIHPSL